MALSVEPIPCDRLVALLRQEQSLYARFLDLSRRQLGVIEQGDVSELLSLLGRKQEVLGQVEGVEQQLAPAKRYWEQMRASFSEDQRSLVESLIQAVRRVLEELIALEKQGEESLQAQRRRTLARIEQTDRGSRLGDAYGAGAKPVVNRYVDTTDVEEGQDG